MTIDINQPNKVKHVVDAFTDSSCELVTLKKKKKILTKKNKNIQKRFIVSQQQYNKCFQNYYHGFKYLMSNPIYVSNIKPSVNHWQLRDLLKFNDDDDLLYYTRDDSIYYYDLNKQHTKEYIKLNYYPRCFNHYKDVLVTGGLLTSSSKLFSLNLDNLTATGTTNNNGIPSKRIAKGLFSFYNPNLNISKTVKLGEMINNDVTIYPNSSNSFISYVCNNDTHLYCLDINNNSNIKVTNKINCEVNTCLNNVVKNPKSNNILTATGDSSSIFLIDPNQSGNKPIIKTIKSGHESGFGVAYHPNGILFSTVFQDGICQIYDLRNLSEKLIEIKSTRQGHQSGAFRVCKFSPENDMNDLLIISEHVGRVHLIDLRNLDYNNVDDHQVIVVPVGLDQFADFKSSIQNPHTRTRGERFDQYSLHQDDNSHHRDNHHQDDLQEQDNKNKINKPRQKYPIDVYPNNNNNIMNNANNISFTAPIVYDYDYLTNINPKLFKDFAYIPPPPPPPQFSPTSHNNDNDYSLPPKLNYPQWDPATSSSSSSTAEHHVSPTSSARPSITGIHTNPSYAYPTTTTTQASYSYPRGNSTDFQAPMIVSSSLSQDSSYTYNNYCDDSYQQCTNHIHGEMELSGIEFVDPKYTNNSKIIIGCQDAGILMWDINGISRRSFGNFDYV
ncbi:uncharacterized protein J8A68_006058 [[Candida] subhashii]|uniref:DUF2415 domain-containing protein n=1 Tax=[Candida] subhashii TaxID=561895 RepID=A0A8J5QB67_9ASCO|nr:uncharacterized protein J8A68_006058 [[Candida] subhashii]KAG7660432.1 hypothetical protein J8A68_006058 [[Candida] subhashii]